VSAVSRSDVNIMAVVNTETKQIQLINTPRDYYVELPNSHGVKDKLTHAGLYGVDNSIGTLEMLYDVDIDYFVRMNFSGFEAIIDSVGGIDVYSEYDFTVEPIKHYVKGMNHLTGLEALAFARERHAFANGDLQRGKNQMAVITAILDKMMSLELLYNYADVLEAVEGTFQTNFTSDEIYTLVKKVLVSPGDWTIDSFAVTGSGSKSTTYSMPNTKTYVMNPNESDVENVRCLIKEVLGESLCIGSFDF
jgi:LCP family protein required for cell wall assembly